MRKQLRSCKQYSIAACKRSNVQCFIHLIRAQLLVECGPCRYVSAYWSHGYLFGSEGSASRFGKDHGRALNHCPSSDFATHRGRRNEPFSLSDSLPVKSATSAVTFHPLQPQDFAFRRMGYTATQTYETPALRGLLTGAGSRIGTCLHMSVNTQNDRDGHAWLRLRDRAVI